MHFAPECFDHLFDIEGKHVKWGYEVALKALQREEGLWLGNKLTKVHVQWEKQENEGMICCTTDRVPQLPTLWTSANKS